jgi:hypothetical protein
MLMPAKLRMAIRWIRRNPLYGIIAVAAPVLGAVTAIPQAWPALASIAGVPNCLSYSDIYYFHNGHFLNASVRWVEYQKNVQITFQEMYRNRDYIVLINKTPRNDPRWESMLVRLPVCGGTAQWTYENPQQWIDLYTISRSVSDALAREHATFRQAKN